MEKSEKEKEGERGKGDRKSEGRRGKQKEEERETGDIEG